MRRYARASTFTAARSRRRGSRRFLRARQVEALDFFGSVVARPGMQLAMDLRPGDLQLVSNLVVLHSRTEYQDGEGHRRHLLRIWLNHRSPRRRGPTLLELYAPWAARRTSPG